MNELKKLAQSKMEEAFQAFSRALSKVRAGRANPAMLDDIKIDVYGSEMPLSQVANIGNEDNRTLVISVWDKGNVPLIEKAIMTSDLGLNPSTSSQNIRLVIPPLTEESRKVYIKQVKSESENSKVSIRNIRREALQKAKTKLKESEFTEDDVRSFEQLVQKLTDQFVANIEERLSQKEQELKHI